MGDEGPAKMDDALRASTGTPSATHPAEHEVGIKPPASPSTKPVTKDRSMSVSEPDGGHLSKSSLAPGQDDVRAPELVAFEDMSLREHYKVSEKLYEVRQNMPRAEKIDRSERQF